MFSVCVFDFKFDLSRRFFEFVERVFAIVFDFFFDCEFVFVENIIIVCDCCCVCRYFV